jgi:hypothetical protein
MTLPRLTFCTSYSQAWRWLALGAALVAGCTSVPLPPPEPPKPPPVVVPPPPPPPPVVVVPEAPPALISQALTPQEYRKSAAAHIYELNRSRIYSGKMPPLLYAVGVLQVDVDRRGHVVGLNWMRAPNHAPEVIAEIERMARAAEPYPAPVRLGRVTYTDVWLWDKSGRFQLDTLTEGQM